MTALIIYSRNGMKTKGHTHTLSLSLRVCVCACVSISTLMTDRLYAVVASLVGR